MTKPKKDNVNWYLVVLGLLFCLCFLWPDEKIIVESELETKEVILSHDIQKLGGRNDKYAYRFWIYEFPCSFVISKVGDIAAHFDNLDNTTKNDSLSIKIHKSRLTDLKNNSADIPIYSLIKNGKVIYDIDSYNKSQREKSKRWNVFFIIISIPFILGGMSFIKNKGIYFLAGLVITIVITLRLLNKWW